MKSQHILVGATALIGWLAIPSDTSSHVAQWNRSQDYVATPEQLQQEPENLLLPRNLVWGSYYFGDGLGVNCSLKIKKDKTFEFLWRGCLGVYDENTGEWGWDEDVLVVRPMKPNRNVGFRGMGLRFVPVRVGRKVFLVDENHMNAFAASLPVDESQGRSFQDYVRELDPSQLVDDRDYVFPNRFEWIHSNGPITVTITKVLSDGRVEIAPTSKEGLKKGMLLAADSFGRYPDLVVTAVHKRSAIAKRVYYWNTDTEPTVSTKYTTGKTWSRPHGTGYERFERMPEENKKAGTR